MYVLLKFLLQEAGVDEANSEDLDYRIMSRQSEARVSHREGWVLMRFEIWGDQVLWATESTYLGESAKIELIRLSVSQTWSVWSNGCHVSQIRWWKIWLWMGLEAELARLWSIKKIQGNRINDMLASWSTFLKGSQELESQKKKSYSHFVLLNLVLFKQFKIFQDECFAFRSFKEIKGLVILPVYPFIFLYIYLCLSL